MTTETSRPFRRCHLQILRSLYAGQDGVTKQQRHGDQALLLLGAAIDHCAGGDENCANEREETNINAEAKQASKDGSSGADHSVGDDSDEPVGSEIWDLIELFLQRRMEYRPHKERRIHWAKISAEAQYRLDHLVSTTSVDEENHVQTQSRSLSSLTPRTPLFCVSGRGYATSSQTLTPPSSNRNTSKLSQNERKMASTVPAWNFINHMLQRRSKLCTESCQSFRSQPFLAELRNEAELRCKKLERALERLKMGTPRNQERNEKKRESAHGRTSRGKRQKLGMEVARPTIPSSLGHFLSDEYSELTKHDLDDECVLDEDSIMETEMKLCLWASLLSSVKEIVDES